MRPHVLSPLFAGISRLDGIGPRLEKLIGKLLGRSGTSAEPNLIDLLLHFPTGLIDRSKRPAIAEAVPGELVTLEVRVGDHSAPPQSMRRLPYRVTCSDDTGTIELIFFHGDGRYLERMLPRGEKRLVSGRVEIYSDRLQMPHPDHIVAPEAIEDMPLLEPVYPLTGGLSGKVLRRAMSQALDQLPALPEWQDEAWLARRHWPDFGTAMKALHAPASLADLLPGAPPRQRLAFDELLANQLALAMVRAHLRRIAGQPLRDTGELRGEIETLLPFSLTTAQNMALAEIDADLRAPHRMLRLLQGDVGSGKTVVALLTMASAVEAGRQAALMAPTEVLCRQHHQFILPIAEKVGIRLGLLTGREKGAERRATLAALEAGEIDILVGTHALFQEAVVYKDLAVAVIDEQHRFGVHQRLALQAKGSGATDVLVMTATPIPRTLLLTHYGDMDVSKLTEKPAGRLPITTRALANDRLQEVVARLEAAISEGAQAYWVCPLIEESDVLDVAAAEDRFAGLQERFGDSVAMIHGRMKGAEKDEIMQGFVAGRIAILVATTVIEVGVDVPNATIMVIEHAERFGLAQLHQLRGRVGRGSRASACILLYQGPLSETALARLKVLRETEDGFVLAEEDLKHRGGGEVLGTRQSGMPEFRVARLPEDQELLMAARDDAKLILNNDPELKSERGEALRTLLYLFQQDEAVRLLRAG